MENKEINFYLQYDYDPEKAELQRKYFKIFGPPIGILIVIVIIFLSLTIGAFVKNSKADNNDEYINSSKTISAYQDAKIVADNLDEANNIYSDLTNAKEEILKMPLAKGELFSKLLIGVGNSKIQSLSYDTTTGSIVLTVSSTSEKNMPKIVERLGKDGSFTKIAYSGYAGDSGTYQAEISCNYK